VDQVHIPKPIAWQTWARLILEHDEERSRRARAHFTEWEKRHGKVVWLRLEPPPRTFHEKVHERVEWYRVMQARDVEGSRCKTADTAICKKCLTVVSCVTGEPRHCRNCHDTGSIVTLSELAPYT
jgi:hypothetical protein